MNKYTRNSSKDCVLKVDHKYPKELRELHNNYPLVPEIKRQILSDYQLKIADLYNITIFNLKKIMPNFFDKEKYVIHYENFQLYLRLELKLKKISLLEFNQLQWLKPYVEFNTQKRTEAEKNGDK